MPLPNFLDLYPLSTVATRMRPVIQAIAAFEGSKGQPLGLAALDAAGKVPMAQLPPLDPTIPDGSVTGAKLAPNLSYSTNGAASLSGLKLSGTVFSGGTGTTTVPWVCYETTGAPVVSSWSTAGTVLGINAAGGFAGNLVDLRVNGVSSFKLTSAGFMTCTGIDLGVNGRIQGLYATASLTFYGSWATVGVGAPAGTYGLQIGGGPGFFAMSANTLRVAAVANNAQLKNLEVATLITAMTAVAGLPSGLVGMRAFVSDSIATHAAGVGTIVSAGGTNIVPVYFNGTNWIVG